MNVEDALEMADWVVETRTPITEFEQNVWAVLKDLAAEVRRLQSENETLHNNLDYWESIQ